MDAGGDLTEATEDGAVDVVHVGDKPDTKRRAVARCERPVVRWTPSLDLETLVDAICNAL